MPLLLGILVVGGLFGAGWVLKEGNDLVENAGKQSGKLTHFALLGGVLYALSVAFGRDSVRRNRRPRRSYRR